MIMSCDNENKRMVTKKTVSFPPNVPVAENADSDLYY